MPGRFIVFEGIDGSGKSTTIAAVAQRLNAAGIKTAQLREPTEKTDASREIRRILRTAEKIDAKVSQDLLELFLIDRLWDIRHQIEPAIRAGSVVLLDRYFISTCAYQAADASETQKIMHDYLSDARILRPDLVIFLNLPVTAAIKRLSGRDARDVFETESRLAGIASRYSAAMTYLQNTAPGITVHEMVHELTEKDFDSLAATITGAAA
jgi:dTMP kinase